MTFQPTAKVIADSLNAATGDRLTTMVLKYHRFIHSELMTHRVFSRNSSSSRAIPVNKLIQNIIDDDVYPLHWGKNQKGMQASEEILKVKDAELAWRIARNEAIKSAQSLLDLGIHKQVANRILEPFSTITAVISATEWDGFFKQRCHPDAQPEIQALANAMFNEYTFSKPDKLLPGEWHIPFISSEDDLIGITQAVVVSTGRCARVSYLNHEGVRDLGEDVKLHDKLLGSNPKHLSPFEHQAQAQSQNNFDCANFKGFKQYRKFIEEGTYETVRK